MPESPISPRFLHLWICNKPSSRSTVYIDNGYLITYEAFSLVRIEINYGYVAVFDKIGWLTGAFLHIFNSAEPYSVLGALIPAKYVYDSLIYKINVVSGFWVLAIITVYKLILLKMT